MTKKQSELLKKLFNWLDILLALEVTLIFMELVTIDYVVLTQMNFCRIFPGFILAIINLIAIAFCVTCSEKILASEQEQNSNRKKIYIGTDLWKKKK